MERTFADTESEHRRLVILQALKASADFSSNEYVLVDNIAHFGHRVSAARLRTDLAWLDEQGLVIGQQPGGVWVVTLTQSGEDVACGLTTVPGVKRPRPGV